MRSRSRKFSAESIIGLIQLDRILAKIQFGILLAAVLLVPLVVLPESNFVDITSTPKTTFLRMLGSLQLGVLLSRLVLSFSNADDHRLVNSLQAIKVNRPALAILASVVAVGIVSVISAALSILPHQSWWGRVPAAFEAGEFTALMYIVFSVSAFISVGEFGKNDWFWRTLATTGFLAVLVGFFQFLGWSPLDISSTHSVRLTGTNGNPIFFGAMLIVLTPITLGVLLAGHQSSSSNSKRWWLGAIAVASFLIAISILSTASRGPWVGAFSGGVVAIISLGVYGRTKAIRLPVFVVIAFAIFGSLIVTFVDPTPPENSTGIDDSNGITSTFSSVGRTSTLDLRMRYWRLSARMAVDRETVPYTHDAPQIVRWLFGYGPDMFRYAGTYFSDNTTFSHRLTAAHNDPINRLVEQGLFGFVAWIGLWLAVGFGSLVLIRRSGHIQNNPRTWVAIAIAIALTARFVEQLFGSPTPGGVLAFWVVIGGLAALLIETETKPVAKPVRPAFPTTVPVKPRVPVIAIQGVMLLIMIGSITLAWDKGANYLIANQMASFQYRSDTVSAEDAIDRLKQAVNLAPDVPRYWHDLAVIEHGRAKATNSPITKSEALSQAYEYDLKAHEANPMEVGGIYDLAFSAWEAGNAGRPELRQEAVRLYERLVIIIPSDELARERLQILKDFLAK